MATKVDSMKQTKELLALVLSLGNALAESLEDGKVDLSDVVEFIPVISKIAPAFADVDDIPAEFAQVDAAQMAELVKYVKDTFDIPQENLEAKIEMGLEAAAKLLALILAFRGPIA